MAEDKNKETDIKKEAAEEKSNADVESKDTPVPKKSNIRFIVLGALLVAVIGGAAFFFLGGVQHSKKQNSKTFIEEKLDPAKIVYFDVPDILVNLRTTGKQRFLKASFTLEVKNKNDLATVETLTPRIVDTFQSYLRELRVSDIAGIGVEHIKQELLIRTNRIIKPKKVLSVLVKSFLVQ